MELERYVRMIQDRGGRVAFIKYPITDESWQYDEAEFPKSLYWDALAARTSATCIHFRDYAELSCFDCPDTSHIDAADAPSFTHSLMQVLERNGVFECNSVRARLGIWGYTRHW